jgi:hypothetical protein
MNWKAWILLLGRHVYNINIYHREDYTELNHCRERLRRAESFFDRIYRVFTKSWDDFEKLFIVNTWD